MRNWIDIIAETEELDEERLDERSVTIVDLPSKSHTAVNSTVEVAVMSNPSRMMLLRMNKVINKGGWFRGFLLEDGNVVVFDAFNATHQQIGLALGISGRRFELRGSGGEIVTMLYLPRSEEGKSAEWRANPMVARMFPPEGFHVGLLRS